MILRFSPCREIPISFFFNQRNNNTMSILKYRFAWTLFIIITFTIPACDKNETDLLDPEETGQFVFYNTSNGLPGNFVWDLKLDSRGDLWFATYGQGVSRYDGESWTVYNTSNSNILNNNVTCIEEDPDGDMWFGTDNGITFLVDNSSWFYLTNQDTILNVLDIKTVSTDLVLVGTDGLGYIIYDGYDFYYSDPSPISEQNTINVIEVDGDGNIWFGTDYGAFRYDYQNWNGYFSSNGLPDDAIWSIYADSRGRIWFGTGGGGEVAYYDGSRFHVVSLFNGKNWNAVVSIFEDKGGDIWFGTWFNGAIRYDGVLMHSYKEYNGFLEDDIEAIASDKDGNVWFGGWSKGAAKYTLPVTLK